MCSKKYTTKKYPSYMTNPGTKSTTKNCVLKPTKKMTENNHDLSGSGIGTSEWPRGAENLWLFWCHCGDLDLGCAFTVCLVNNKTRGMIRSTVAFGSVKARCTYRLVVVAKKTMGLYHICVPSQILHSHKRKKMVQQKSFFDPVLSELVSDANVT